MKVISNEDISYLCLELSMLLQAGVMPGDALTLIAQESDAEFNTLLTSMSEEVDGGASLAEAFRNADCFPSYVCRLLETGEQTGRSAESLEALSRYYESMGRLNRRVRQALLYPAMMLVLMLIVVGILLVRVLPIFDDVYASMGGRLTGIAGGLLSLGRWLDSVMPVLWGILAVVAVFSLLFALVGPFRTKVTGWWRSKRGDKGVSRKINDSRLAQVLSMYMASGLPMEDALTQAADLLEEVPAARNRCLQCRDRIEKGETTWNALRESELLPAASCRLLDMAQKSGSADQVMAKIAGDLEEESEAEVEDKVSRIEPALVLLSSVLVGLILVSVMLPLMHIMAAIG